MLLLLLFKFRSFRIGAFSLPASGKTIPATVLFRHSGAQRGIAGGNPFEPGQPAAKGKTTNAVYGDGGGTPERGPADGTGVTRKFFTAKVPEKSYLQGPKKGSWIIFAKIRSELLNFTGASTRGDCKKPFLRG